MGIIDAVFDSFGGMLSDQWQDVFTAGPFDEHTVVAPGVRKDEQNGRGNNFGSSDIITNGSVIFVPENTAAFVFSQSGIEQVITQPGGFEYRDGQASVLNRVDRAEKGLGRIIFDEAAERVRFSGMSPNEKRIAYVNLREIRGIKFGTRGPLAYNDLFYGTDLEIFAYGVISLQVVDPVRFVQSFVPPNTGSYSFDSAGARSQIVPDFLHSFICEVNALSETHRISQLPSQARAIAQRIAEEDDNAGTWEQRFGLKLVSIAIENIEFSDDSRALVRQFSERKMSVRAYEDTSQHAANIAAQQMIAEGVRSNGFGDAGGMLFGMNLASGLNPMTAAPLTTATPAPNPTAPPVTAPAPAQTPAPQPAAPASFDEQIEALKKLKELLDAGILSQAEFDAKKREVLGL